VNENGNPDVNGNPITWDSHMVGPMGKKSESRENRMGMGTFVWE